MSAPATTFVQYVDEDPALDLALQLKRVCELDSKSDVEISELIGEHDYPALLQLLLARYLPTLGTASIADFELLVSLCFALFEQVEPAAQTNLSHALAKFLIVAPMPDSHLGSRIKLLTTLFNLLSSSNAYRADILVGVLSLTVTPSTVAMLSPATFQPVNVAKWVAAWQAQSCSPKVISDLYLALAHYFTICENSELSCVYYMKYFGTFASAAALDGLTPELFRFVKVCLAADSMVKFDDVLKLAVLSTLAQNVNLAPLAELFRVVEVGAVDKCVTFVAKQTSFLKRNFISTEQLLLKTRLVALCQMAAAQPRLPMAQITHITQSGTELDTERLIVKAITLKLLVAKIDQETEELIVERVVSTTGSVQWQQLQKSLGKLKGSVDSLCQSFEQLPERAAVWSQATKNLTQE